MKLVLLLAGVLMFFGGLIGPSPYTVAVTVSGAVFIGAAAIMDAVQGAARSPGPGGEVAPRVNQAPLHPDKDIADYLQKKAEWEGKAGDRRRAVKYRGPADF